MVTALASLLTSLAGIYVLLGKHDKLRTQNNRIEHLVNSQLEQVMARVDVLEVKLKTRTKQRDDAEAQLPDPPPTRLKDDD